MDAVLGFGAVLGLVALAVLIWWTLNRAGQLLQESRPCDCGTFFCEHYGRRLQWIPVYPIARFLRNVWVLILVGFGIVTVFYVLSALNWAPLWGRLYSTCMEQAPEANTVTDIIQQRVDCAKAASRAIQDAK